MNVTLDGINYSYSNNNAGGISSLWAIFISSNDCEITSSCTTFPQNNFTIDFKGVDNVLGTDTSCSIIFYNYPMTKYYLHNGSIQGTSCSVTITSVISNPTDFIEGTFIGNVCSFDSIPQAGTLAPTIPISGSFKVSNF